jgi:hypothetical protein
MATTNTKPEAETKPEAVVQYVGTSDVRQITAAEWTKAGVKDQNKVVWDASNRHKVPVSELSAEALELLKGDSAFKLPEA